MSYSPVGHGEAIHRMRALAARAMAQGRHRAAKLLLLAIVERLHEWHHEIGVAYGFTE